MRRCSLLLLAALAACELPTALPPGAQRFDPPAVYREWWALTEACSGLRGDFESVQWYEVPATSIATRPAGEEVNALWIGDGNRIVLTSAPNGRREGDLVRHEMLHALLRDGRHPRAQFIGRCGGVVVCVRACDEGPSTAPPADPAAIPVAPAELDVAVDVRGLAPTPPDSGVYVTMVVAAHNPSSDPWVVQLPPSGDVGAPESVAYRLEDAYGYTVWFSLRADAPEVTRFAPGETKRFVFDFWVHGGRPSTRYELAPGTWTFHGAFGGVWAPRPPTLVLNP